MKQYSVSAGLLFLLILNFFILQSNALVSSSSILSSSGMINYNPTPEDGWLHTDGVYIKDANNNIVAWRGIHIGGYYYQGQLTVTQGLIDIAKAHGAAFLELGWNLKSGSEYILDFAKLDQTINLAEQNNMYVILNYLEASTRLINDGLATGWQDVIPIDTWREIIQRYASRPVVVGVKLIDEPNFSGEEQRQMYYDAIDALKPYNPNLIWITHYINWKRMRYSDDRLMWRNASEVPANTIVGGGGWVRTSSDGVGEPTLELDDYAKADAYIAQEVIPIMTVYRDKVQIPVVMGAYGSSRLEQDNAHTYYLRESGRALEKEKIGYDFYISEYYWRWNVNNGDAICDRLLPDAPYSKYW